MVFGRYRVGGSGERGCDVMRGNAVQVREDAMKTGGGILRSVM